MLGHISVMAADWGGLSCEPPTTVSCAPRRIAFGSKFDMDFVRIVPVSI